jgi:hypothetical protein
MLSSKSYEDLRTFNGTVYDTFYKACVALGLLKDDQEWIEYFNEAVVFARGSSLCRLFAMALPYGGISHPLGTWEQFCNYFCDEIAVHRLEQLNYPATHKNP